MMSRLISKTALQAAHDQQPNNPKLPAVGSDYLTSYTRFLLLWYTFDGLRTSQMAELLGLSAGNVKKYMGAMKELGLVADIRLSSGKVYWHILPKGINTLERRFGWEERVFEQKKGTYKLRDMHSTENYKPKHSAKHDAYMSDVLCRMIQSFPSGLGGVEKAYGPIVTKMLYTKKTAISIGGKECWYDEPVYWPDGMLRMSLDGKWLNVNVEMDASRQDYTTLIDKASKLRIYAHLNSKRCRIEEHVIAFVVKGGKGTTIRPSRIVDLFNQRIPTDTNSFNPGVQKKRAEFFKGVAIAPLVIATTLKEVEQEQLYFDPIWSTSHDNSSAFSLMEIIQQCGHQVKGDEPAFVGGKKWIEALKEEDLEWVWWK